MLVDRIWPRGLSKEKADLDEWCKTVAPSTKLRKWYSHDPERFEEFGRRYRSELQEPEGAETLEHLRALARHGNLVLLTATKQVNISEATYALVKDVPGLTFTPRGKVQAKGKGEMEMYFVAAQEPPTELGPT